PCRTRAIALVGAAPHAALDRLAADPRLVRKYGTEAGDLLGDPELLLPLADGVDVTLAELVFAVRHEGALDVDDLLDRRTRIGLVSTDRDRCLPAAERALRIAG